jgi:DNA-binding response OmpR family regulator
VSLAKVLVVEDEQFIRTMLNVSLQAFGFNVVGLRTTAREALNTVEQGTSDVAILDLDLGPGPSGGNIADAH